MFLAERYPSGLVALRADDVDLDRDRTLVRRYQDGDDDAFGELYRRYHDRLERFCRRRVGDHHTAEEVAQEAFTRALTALPELGGEQRFYPWVTVIAARLCVDSHRRQSRWEPAPDLDLGAVSGGQEEIIEAVDAALVMTAMAKLAPRHRDVLHLREVEGWSYQRIADHYEVPVGTVETLLFRARRALRREFRLVDRAGLAALPVFGRVAVLAARLRSRLPAWVPSFPSPGSAAAAATATAAAVVLVVVPARAGGRPPTIPPAHHVAAGPAAVRGPTPISRRVAPGATTGTNLAITSTAVSPLPATSVQSTGAATAASADPVTTAVAASPATTTTALSGPVAGSVQASPVLPAPSVPDLAVAAPVTLPPVAGVTNALPPLLSPSAVVGSVAPIDLGSAVGSSPDTVNQLVTGLLGGGQ